MKTHDNWQGRFDASILHVRDATMLRVRVSECAPVTDLLVRVASARRAGSTNKHVHQSARLQNNAISRAKVVCGSRKHCVRVAGGIRIKHGEQTSAVWALADAHDRLQRRQA